MTFNLILKILGVLLSITLLVVLGGWALNLSYAQEYMREHFPESPYVMKKKSKNVWTVYFTDKPDYIFEVRLILVYDLFDIIPKREIRSNFNYMFAGYYYNEYIAIRNTTLVLHDGDYGPSLHGYFSTEEEAKILARDIVQYLDYAQSQKYTFITESIFYSGYMTGSGRRLISFDINFHYESPNLVDGRVFPYNDKISFFIHNDGYDYHEIERTLLQAIDFGEHKIERAINEGYEDSYPYEDERLGLFSKVMAAEGPNYFFNDEYKTKDYTVSIYVWAKNNKEMTQCIDGIHTMIDNIDEIDTLVQETLLEDLDSIKIDAASGLKHIKIRYYKDGRFALCYDLRKKYAWKYFIVTFNKNRIVIDTEFSDLFQ